LRERDWSLCRIHGSISNEKPGSEEIFEAQVVKAQTRDAKAAFGRSHCPAGRPGSGYFAVLYLYRSHGSFRRWDGGERTYLAEDVSYSATVRCVPATNKRHDPGGLGLWPNSRSYNHSMNIDGRLEKLVERHEALTQSTELLRIDAEQTDRRIRELADIVGGLTGVVRNHRDGLDNLER